MNNMGKVVSKQLLKNSSWVRTCISTDGVNGLFHVEGFDMIHSPSQRVIQEALALQMMVPSSL